MFEVRTWRKAQILLVGAILTPGRRTVAAALRVMGLDGDRSYARYHHVLSRASWSSLAASQVLLTLLIRHLDRGSGPLVFGIDETIERRWGPRISARGIYRDTVRYLQVLPCQDQRPALDIPDVAGPRPVGRSPLGSALPHRAGALGAIPHPAGTTPQKAHPTGPAR